MRFAYPVPYVCLYFPNHLQMSLTGDTFKKMVEIVERCREKRLKLILLLYKNAFNLDKPEELTRAAINFVTIEIELYK